MEELDLGAIMADTQTATPPYSDVSNGAPNMQSDTNAGNGFGQWFGGAISKSLDYALMRDQQNMQAKNYGAMPPRQTVGRVSGMNAQGGQLGDRQLMFIGLGLVAFFVLAKK